MAGLASRKTAWLSYIRRRATSVDLSILEKLLPSTTHSLHHFLNIWEQKLGGFSIKPLRFSEFPLNQTPMICEKRLRLSIIQQLQQKQANIRVHDPIAKLPQKSENGQGSTIRTDRDNLRAMRRGILCSEWQDYIGADWENYEHI